MTEKELKIGIQGVEASFHDVAAHQYFRERHGRRISSVECASFKDLCEALAQKNADYCLMAIENTIAGSILTNYSLLEMYRFKTIGEVYLRIELHLMALRDQAMSDLYFIQSHPMALLQCEEFLFRHPSIKVIEASDTAESAKNIAAKKMSGYAAIASKLAAEKYGLNILASEIETSKSNYTRFLVIARDEPVPVGDEALVKEANKCSLRFETAHEPGSLLKVLEIFKEHSLNLTKIQSVPILGKPYQYSIHVDLEWQDRQAYERAMAELPKKASHIIHFGEYARGSLQ
jgi:prephenate dehydratase